MGEDPDPKVTPALRRPDLMARAQELSRQVMQQGGNGFRG
jgi:hypothetical protein